MVEYKGTASAGGWVVKCHEGQQQRGVQYCVRETYELSLKRSVSHLTWFYLEIANPAERLVTYKYFGCHEESKNGFVLCTSHHFCPPPAANSNVQGSVCMQTKHAEYSF